MHYLKPVPPVKLPHCTSDMTQVLRKLPILSFNNAGSAESKVIELIQGVPATVSKIRNKKSTAEKMRSTVFRSPSFPPWTNGVFVLVAHWSEFQRGRSRFSAKNKRLMLHSSAENVRFTGLVLSWRVCKNGSILCWNGVKGTCATYFLQKRKRCPSLGKIRTSSQGT